MMKRLLKLFIYFLQTTLLVAQALELPKNLQSSTAASLGKFGDINMDLYSGRANVSIPLYSVNELGIPLEISMQYDTGGVRVNDVPGWVGQNWSLNSGGAIIRTQKGKGFDEGKTCSSTGISSNWGYKYYYKDLQSPDWSSSSNIKTLALNYLNQNGQNKDYEPDIFTFNFMGKTGKFFLAEDGTWKVSSKDNLKIEINDADYILPFNINYYGNQTASNIWRRCPSIGKIKITDDQGNYYLFGKTENEIEYTIDSYDNQSELALYSNAWYLSEVYNKFGTKVYSFEYERGDDQGNLYIDAGSKYLKRDACGSYGACGQTISLQAEATVYGALIKPIYLSKISTKSGITIKFRSANHNSLKYEAEEPIVHATNYRKSEFYNNLISTGQSNQAWNWFNNHFWYSVHTPINNNDPISENPIYQTGNYYNSLSKVITEWRWRKLSNINIQDANDVTIKSVSFNYNDDSTKRLKLQKIVIDNLYKYLFEYNNFELLPKFCSQSVDHFGYYNGNNYNVNNIDFVNHYNNRETNENFVQYGTLSKITYPLGGYTKFEYEPHDYSSYVSEDKKSLINQSGIIGGVRIKRLTDYSDNDNAIIKEYVYKNDLTSNISSGILLTKPIYVVNNFIGKTLCGSNFYEYSYNMNSIVPLSNFLGTQIEYPTVIEKRLSSKGDGLGYIKTNYTSYIDYKNQIRNTLQQSFSIFDPITDLSFKRGMIKNKFIFDSNNNLKYAENYTYDIISDKKVKALSYDIFATCIFQGSVPSTTSGQSDGNPAIKATAYEIYYSDFKLKSKTSKIFDNFGNSIEEFETYNYSDIDSFGDTFLKNRNKITSKLDTLREVYKYTFDNKNFSPYNTMTDRREFSIVETAKYLNQSLLEKTNVAYSPVSTVDLQGNLVTPQIFPHKLLTSNGINEYEENLIFDKYDADGHILKKHSANGTYYYCYYGYNNKFPILKIEGPEINNESALSDLVNKLLKLLKTVPNNYDLIISEQLNIIKALPNQHCELYTYKSEFGVASIMKSSGIIEYYDYDYTGRLISIKDQNGKMIKSYTYEIKN